MNTIICCIVYTVAFLVVVHRLELLGRVLGDEGLHISESLLETVSEVLGLSLERSNGNRDVFILDHVAKTKTRASNGTEREVVERRASTVRGGEDGSKVSSIGGISEESRTLVSSLALRLLEGEPVEDLQVTVDELSILRLLGLEDVAISSSSECSDLIFGGS